jgi:putative SOS response-associated peptidase YedK
MCGRFTLDLPPEKLAEIFGLAELPRIEPRYNIAPTQQVAAIRTLADNEHRKIAMLKWGFIPSWTKDPSLGHKLINARSESIHEKRAFRQAIRYHRCIIPTSGFFEWEEKEGKKTPLYIRLKDGSPMCFAGIWDHWKSPEGEVVESCSMLTTSSNKLIEPLHDRMPVILHPQEYALWLDRTITDPEKLKPLYQPYPADLMGMWPVSSLVNSSRNDSPACIEKVVS